MNKGFSLLEVIISTLIAVVLISGLFLSYKASWDMIKESSEMATIRTTAISKLEELRAYTSSEIRSYNGTTFSTTVSTGETINGTITVSTTDPPLVTITMTWGSSSAPRSVSVSAILYRPLYEVE